MKTRQIRQTFKGTFSGTIRGRYLLFLPADYKADGRNKWPLLLFLHGAGERGTNLSLVAKHGPPKVMQQRPDLPFIIVSPQCPEGQIWSHQTLMPLIEDVVAHHRVDRSRIYLTGLSMGGYGVWDLALTYPERFAAIAPVCGGGDIIKILLAEPKKLRAIKSLPVWAFHGAKDPVVPVHESQRMVAALREVGNDAQLTIYPEAAHDSWTETYNNPALYDWFLTHRRRATHEKAA